MSYICKKCFCPLVFQNDLSNNNLICPVCGEMYNTEDFSDEIFIDENELKSINETKLEEIVPEFDRTKIEVDILTYKKVYNAYLKLPSVGKIVIDLRFGFCDGVIHSYSDIAKKLEFSVESVKKIEAKCLRLLAKI